MPLEYFSKAYHCLQMDMKQLEYTGRDPGGTEFLVLLPEEKVTVSVQTNNAIENFDRDFRTKTNYKKLQDCKENFERGQNQYSCGDNSARLH